MSTRIIGHKLGNVQPDGITFWVGIISSIKNVKAKTASIEITNSKNKKKSILNLVQDELSGEEKPFTGSWRATVKSLSSYSKYTYIIKVNGKSFTSKGYTLKGCFTTAPKLTEKIPVKILVASCIMAKKSSPKKKGEDKKQKAWNYIVDKHSDTTLSLLIGDTIYVNSHERRRHWEFTEAQFNVNEAYQEHLAKTPVYAIYDDHDFVNNDKYGAGNAAITPEKNPRRIRTARYFKDLWVIPKIKETTKIKQEGCFQKIQYGMIDIYILDTRYYREPLGRGNIKYGENGKPPIEVLDNRKYLSLFGSPGCVLRKKRKGVFEKSSVKIGNSQWEWLRQEFGNYKKIKNGDDRIKIITFSSPINKGEARLDKYDWEMNQLKKLLKPQKNVLFLSGSLHKLRHYTHEGWSNNGEIRHEFVSSGIGRSVAETPGGFMILHVFPDDVNSFKMTYHKPNVELKTVNIKKEQDNHIKTEDL